MSIEEQQINLDKNGNFYIIIATKNNKHFPLRFEGRDIIKVGMKRNDLPDIVQAFYRSTGSNTTERGSFFPFNYISMKLGYSSKKGNFKLTESTWLNKTGIMGIKTDFNQKKLGIKSGGKEIKNGKIDPRKLLYRLGNCELAVMSYVLGGSVWNKEFIKIYKKYCPTLTNIRTNSQSLLDNLDLYTYENNIINLPEKDTIRFINTFISTSTTLNNYNTLNLSDEEYYYLNKDEKIPIDISDYLDSKKEYTVDRNIKDILLSKYKKEKMQERLKARMKKKKK
tara:strand:- start:27 stop:869 length:843 start_codon:yes stop_codon:yes gene_type:complete